MAALGKDAEIGGQQPLVVGPGFRAKLAIPDAEITMVGPSSAMLLTEDAGTLAVQLTSGRMLVSAGNPEASVQIQLGEEKCRLQLASPDTIAAIELTHKREPGLDPLLAETHVAVRHLIAVNGSVTAEIGGLSSVIESENQWTQVGEGSPVWNHSVPYLIGQLRWPRMLMFLRRQRGRT